MALYRRPSLVATNEEEKLICTSYSMIDSHPTLSYTSHAL
jgi:hypothetical protein